MCRGRIAATILPLLVLVVLFSLLAAQKSPLIGSWDGTWDSVQGQTGTFVMAVDEKPDGTLAGKMTVSQGGTEMYSAPLKTIVVNGADFQASYDTPDGQAEIIVQGTLTENKVAGKWKVKIPGQDLIEAGNWQASKKVE